jgi:hypothetical protein
MDQSPPSLLEGPVPFDPAWLLSPFANPAMSSAILGLNAAHCSKSSGGVVAVPTDSGEAGASEGLGLPRFGGQFDYAGLLILAALSNSAGLTQPSLECLRSKL